MKWLLSLLGASLLATPCGAAQRLADTRCAVVPVPVAPATVENGARYQGHGERFEIEFHNDRRDGAVQVFPEPPVRIRSLTGSSACEIADGGVWNRRGVFEVLGTDGAAIVAMNEFSGSFDALVFYDASSCRRLASLDVSGTRWTINGAGVGMKAVSTPASASRARRMVRLGGDCLPVK